MPTKQEVYNLIDEHIKIFPVEGVLDANKTRGRQARLMLKAIVDFAESTEPGTGIDGKTVLNGLVPPDDDIGTTGDFYINTSSWLIYGPKGETSWPQGVSLIGLQGPEGKKLEVQITATHLQYRYEGDVSWQNLLELSLLKGADGRQIELQATGTHLQYRYSGDVVWQNLIALSLLKGTDGTNGTDGTDGTDGREIELRVLNNVLQKRYSGDPSWQDLYDFTSGLQISAAGDKVISGLNHVSSDVNTLSNTFSGGTWRINGIQYTMSQPITLPHDPIDGARIDWVVANKNNTLEILKGRAGTHPVSPSVTDEQVFVHAVHLGFSSTPGTGDGDFVLETDTPMTMQIVEATEEEPAKVNFIGTANDIKGGHHQFSTETERDEWYTLHPELKMSGMLCSTTSREPVVSIPLPANSGSGSTIEFGGKGLVYVPGNGSTVPGRAYLVDPISNTEELAYTWANNESPTFATPDHVIGSNVAAFVVVNSTGSVFVDFVNLSTKSRQTRLTLSITGSASGVLIEDQNKMAVFCYSEAQGTQAVTISLRNRTVDATYTEPPTSPTYEGYANRFYGGRSHLCLVDYTGTTIKVFRVGIDGAGNTLEYTINLSGETVNFVSNIDPGYIIVATSANNLRLYHDSATPVKTISTPSNVSGFPIVAAGELLIFSFGFCHVINRETFTYLTTVPTITPAGRYFYKDGYVWFDVLTPERKIGVFDVVSRKIISYIPYGPNSIYYLFGPIVRLNGKIIGLATTGGQRITIIDTKGTRTYKLNPDLTSWEQVLPATTDSIATGEQPEQPNAPSGQDVYVFATEQELLEFDVSDPILHPEKGKVYIVTQQGRFGFYVLDRDNVEETSNQYPFFLRDVSNQHTFFNYFAGLLDPGLTTDDTRTIHESIADRDAHYANAANALQVRKGQWATITNDPQATAISRTKDMAIGGSRNMFAYGGLIYAITDQNLRIYNPESDTLTAPIPTQFSDSVPSTSNALLFNDYLVLPQALGGVVFFHITAGVADTFIRSSDLNTSSILSVAAWGLGYVVSVDYELKNILIIQMPTGPFTFPSLIGEVSYTAGRAKYIAVVGDIAYLPIDTDNIYKIERIDLNNQLLLSAINTGTKQPYQVLAHGLKLVVSARDMVSETGHVLVYDTANSDALTVIPANSSWNPNIFIHGNLLYIWADGADLQVVNLDTLTQVALLTPNLGYVPGIYPYVNDGEIYFADAGGLLVVEGDHIVYQVEFLGDEFPINGYSYIAFSRDTLYGMNSSTDKLVITDIVTPNGTYQMTSVNPVTWRKTNIELL